MNVLRERARTPADPGQRLVVMRARCGLTQTQVAEALCISHRYVSEIEAGKPLLYSDGFFRLLDLLDAGLVVEGEDLA